MEAEKTQTSSPEPEPKEFQFPDLAAQSTSTASPPAGEVSPFRTNESFWALCLQNPELKREFEERIAREVRARLEMDLSEACHALRAQAYEEGKKEGSAEGREKGRLDLLQDWDVLKKSWEAIGAEYTLKKTSLLRSHEEDWTRSLSHLLHRFLIAEPLAKGEVLGNWLKESINSFPSSARLKVRMSPRQAAFVADLVKGGKISGWETIVDPQLQDGQIALDSDGGGAFFSNKEELLKLEKLVESLWGKEGPASVLPKAA